MKTVLLLALAFALIAVSFAGRHGDDEFDHDDRERDDHHGHHHDDDDIHSDGRHDDDHHDRDRHDDDGHDRHDDEFRKGWRRHHHWKRVLRIVIPVVGGVIFVVTVALITTCVYFKCIKKRQTFAGQVREQPKMYIVPADSTQAPPLEEKVAPPPAYEPVQVNPIHVV